jgi:hypothetical protein
LAQVFGEVGQRGIEYGQIHLILETKRPAIEIGRSSEAGQQFIIQTSAAVLPSISEAAKITREVIPWQRRIPLLKS